MAFETSVCVGCGQVFRFNRKIVPMITNRGVGPAPGCEDCVHVVNAARSRSGMDRINYPKDAYEALLVDIYGEDDYL